MKKRRLVIVESPFAGKSADPEAYAREVAENVAYARRAVADCARRGEAPIASHLLFTQPGILDDKKPEERKTGIECGLAWGRVADYAVFYIDRGMSPGMQKAENFYRQNDIQIRKRRLG